MSDRNTVVRTANTLSLAAWFGGSLMGLVGLPRASTAAGDGAGPAQAARAEGRGWSAWQPVQAGAIASQLASGAALTLANRRRVAGQRGVARASMVRAGMTGLAIGATALAAMSGRRLERALAAQAEGAAGVGSETDGDDGAGVDAIERRTRALQVAVPVLTGALLTMDALMGEQQRPTQVLRGTAQRALPDALADRLAA